MPQFGYFLMLSKMAKKPRGDVLARRLSIVDNSLIELGRSREIRKGSKNVSCQLDMELQFHYTCLVCQGISLY